MPGGFLEWKKTLKTTAMGNGIANELKVDI